MKRWDAEQFEFPFVNKLGHSLRIPYEEAVNFLEPRRSPHGIDSVIDNSNGQYSLGLL